jgi:hypothetical protein
VRGWRSLSPPVCSVQACLALVTSVHSATLLSLQAANAVATWPKRAKTTWCAGNPFPFCFAAKQRQPCRGGDIEHVAGQ